MKVSVVVATNRRHHWERLCASLAANNINIEISIVGPLDVGPATYAVPHREVRTTLPPAACWELGIRLADGDLVCPAADDCLFSAGLFDAAAAHLSTAVAFTMVTGLYIKNHESQLHDMRFLGITGMPLLPVCGIWRRVDHLASGGVDKRFRGALWDTDLAMRFLAAGGQTTLLDGHHCHELNDDNTLFATSAPDDKQTILGLWNITNRRRSAVLPYSDYDLGIGQ